MRTSTVVTPARARCAGFLVFACSLACVPSAFGQAKLVSSWVGPSNGECRDPRVSADGRRAVFVSKATNLEELPTTGLDHVYLWDARDRPFPRVLLVSQDTGGLRANGPSENPSISPDGSYVAFNSTATNLGNPNAGGWSNVYVHAIFDPDGSGPQPETRTTTWVSRTYNGQTPGSSPAC